MKMLLLILLMGIPGMPDEVPDGTIVIKEHSKRIVERVTKSSITHVGIIFNENGVIYVYEAIPPVVHRVPVDEYFKELAKLKKSKPQLEFIIAEPKDLFSETEIRSMKSLADAQLGRKYSVKSYTRGNPDFVGVHCSQYVCDILTRSRRFWSQNSAVVTPDSLWQSIDEKFNKQKINIPEEKSNYKLLPLR